MSERTGAVGAGVADGRPFRLAFLPVAARAGRGERRILQKP
ncbi:hypothetical protein AB0B12_07880 [Streptomyces sp. NPDC044780]